MLQQSIKSKALGKRSFDTALASLINSIIQDSLVRRLRNNVFGTHKDVFILSVINVYLANGKMSKVEFSKNNFCVLKFDHSKFYF